MDKTKRYFGVSYYKSARKWRAYAVHGGRFLYIGLFDNQHLGAAARESFLDDFPEFVVPHRTRRNDVPARWRCAYENSVVDPDQSALKIFTPRVNEVWTALPDFEAYQTSNHGRIRTGRSWGWCEVVTNNGTAILLRDGRLTPIRLPGHSIPAND